MIKGINKQIVIVKCGGEVFEQAIFILKPQKYSDGKTITEEAKKIIKENTSYFSNKMTKKKRSFRRKTIIDNLFEDY
ncbi:MAG: hypothetical protein E7477_07725 [Ruminococcaceae bacterium]|nr:hypothetical protein [Oscillospiraceae bacterium]